MAQNITIQGASYSDVPSVTLPKTGGGTAYFTDVTPTTATESDVASGKIFYKADGSQAVGSHVDSGGTITEDGNGDIEFGKTGDVALITSLSVTENGTYTAPANTGYSPVDVNISESGGTITEDGNGDIELGKTGDVALITPLSVTENGTYTAPANTGYSPVDINVSGGGANVDVQILGTMEYDVHIPIGASQSGNTVSIPNDSMFAIAVYGMLDIASTTGTVTKEVIGGYDPVVAIFPGANGGTITLEGLS